MKKLILCLLIVLIPGIVFAENWCMWSGTEAEYCQSDDSRGYIRMPSELADKTVANNVVTGTEADYNTAGFYKLVVTQPTLGENQVRDEEVWGFADNEISKTWTVRDMTATEIDNRIASPMSVTDYYQWKCLLVTGVITQQQALDNLPPVMVDAYQARKRLLGD